LKFYQILGSFFSIFQLHFDQANSVTAENAHDYFLLRDSTHSAVMPQYVICQSVCLSVTFRYRDHIGWNS